MVMIQLEKFKGTRTRHTCPKCHHKNEFTRFVDDSGNYIADDVGICNRVSNCGYRYTAKQYFADNPNVSKFQSKPKQKYVGANWTRQTSTNVEIKTSSFDFIAPEHLKATLRNYDRNAFVQFLFDLFPDCAEEIEAVLKMYFVGSYEDYCSFPQIDRLNRICKAKLIRFDRRSGKRLKGDYDTSSLVRKLKLKEDFNYKQIFFGEHLLSKYPNKPIAIVEAEKTAIIASLYFSEFVWLGSNSKTWLKTERLQRLGQRQIILYPDADGFKLWQEIATDAQRQGLTVKVSSLIETFATGEQKANGYDLADYLINEQTEINRFNNYVDSYNDQLEKVLSSDLKWRFDDWLDERKAILMLDGNLSESEAEYLITQPSYVQSTVLSL